MATSSNVGRWDGWYVGVDEPQAYANTATYRIGADWLAGCALVEDWGCGKGWLRTLVEPGRYRGIDGSATPFTDEVADLTSYRSEVPGLFMRHVLEHNFEWRTIIDNALASFTQRMALVLFTPFGDETHDIEWEDPPGVPNLSFRRRDLTDRIDASGARWQLETLSTAAKYGVEHVFRIER